MSDLVMPIIGILIIMTPAILICQIGYWLSRRKENK